LHFSNLLQYETILLHVAAANPEITASDMIQLEVPMTLKVLKIYIKLTIIRHQMQYFTDKRINK